ncbi:MAG: pyridoxal-phosphate dependent enzyme [Acidimicrobiia bacterium]|nr:pyridoxal-phosphate dependent enzyme [Acidimicrobiia bacterium]
MPSLADIEVAAGRLDGVANRTPVLTSRTLNRLVGAEVMLKAECFQRTGSFKFRGAYNAVASLSASARSRGVAAFSSGNHAQAVALAAALHDIPAVILMPEDSPTLKLDATRGYGAEVVYFDRYGTRPRHELGEELASERDLTLVPPFDHWDVIAGQGTAALELYQDTGELDTLVVCVGGGGLISGCSTVAKAQSHPTRVVGVEPEAGDDAVQSLARGEIVTIPTPRTIADGQQTTSIGERTFAVMRERVDDMVTVTDDEILAAMRFAFERLNVVLEPSGASALAAVLAGTIDVSDQRVGITLSGGNIGTARSLSLLGG